MDLHYLEMTISLQRLNARPYGRKAVQSKSSFIPGYPVCENANGAEITIAKLETISHITIIGVCRSTQVATQ